MVASSRSSLLCNISPSGEISSEDSEEKGAWVNWEGKGGKETQKLNSLHLQQLQGCCQDLVSWRLWPGPRSCGFGSGALSRAMLTDHLLSPTHWAGAACTCSPPLPKRQEKNIGLQLQGKDGNENQKNLGSYHIPCSQLFFWEGINLLGGRKTEARFLARLKPKSL